MSKARLDAIAKRLPPKPKPAPAWDAFVGDLPRPVGAYLVEQAAREPHERNRAGLTAVALAIAEASRLSRRAPSLPEVHDLLPIS